MQDEDETVDVESYGEETSNGAINMTSQLYNNSHPNPHINSNNSSLNNNNSNQLNNNNIGIMKVEKNEKMADKMEEHAISSLTSLSAMGRSNGSWDKNRLSLNLNCVPLSDSSITRVTPTSSDQRIDVEYELDNEQSQDRQTDEEVVVDSDEERKMMKRCRDSKKR